MVTKNRHYCNNTNKSYFLNYIFNNCLDKSVLRSLYLLINIYKMCATMCSYRNPSPPREEEEPFLLDDAIGDTVYSKRWVLSVVADLCKYAHARCATTERLPADCDVIDETDMDEEWEQELCKLWDASVDEVCNN